MDSNGRIEDHVTDGTIDLVGYSNGAQHQDKRGAVTLMQTLPDGTVKFRRYEATTDWQDPVELGIITKSE